MGAHLSLYCSDSVTMQEEGPTQHFDNVKNEPSSVCEGSRLLEYYERQMLDPES